MGRIWKSLEKQVRKFLGCYQQSLEGNSAERSEDQMLIEMQTVKTSQVRF
jgi:hypothetical protein